ncbi:prespore vesicle protein-like [Acanthaster planci]|uniref:Prespore vesicle protein-like n=1 Tax=Acanthaster planci TaxID=133434 RepID=A0A8B7Z5S7_ACAPL|nr:prespore vesicle protein-like [Acanthaster planci]XP_022100986.1 prespore vesicle protein-like [Acanthaster planci]XP_022100988.1 prespore vesicle protein-like [Acanthaster planci]XP_022100989.1 prespore vesicle protein-like [Acanthaster planci]
MPRRPAQHNRQPRQAHKNRASHQARAAQQVRHAKPAKRQAVIQKRPPTQQQQKRKTNPVATQKGQPAKKSKLLHSQPAKRHLTGQQGQPAKKGPASQQKQKRKKNSAEPHKGQPAKKSKAQHSQPAKRQLTCQQGQPGRKRPKPLQATVRSPQQMLVPHPVPTMPSQTKIYHNLNVGGESNPVVYAPDGNRNTVNFSMQRRDEQQALRHTGQDNQEYNEEDSAVFDQDYEEYNSPDNKPPLDEGTLVTSSNRNPNQAQPNSSTWV